MELYPFELHVNILQIIVFTALPIWRGFKHSGSKSYAHSLFMCGLMSHALLDIYWTASILLEEEYAGAIFKASDTASIACILFWVSMFRVKNDVDYKFGKVKKLLPVTAVLFCIWNLIWWNLWTGNYLINFLWTVPLTMLSFLIFYSLEEGGSFTKGRRYILFGLLAVLFVFEIPMYVTDTESIWYQFSDWLCAGAWFGLVALFFCCAMRDRHRRTTYLFAAMLMSMYGEYMTDGIRYTFFMFSESIVMIVLILVFREEELGEVTAA